MISPTFLPCHISIYENYNMSPYFSTTCCCTVEISLKTVSNSFSNYLFSEQVGNVQSVLLHSIKYIYDASATERLCLIFYVQVKNISLEIFSG